MNYLEFKNKFFRYLCFSTNQVYALHPGFNKNNLTNWVKKGYLVKLKNNWYSFPEYLEKANTGFYIANRLYQPSYVSLHSALAFYGLIPEGIIQIVSVTSLKTSMQHNAFGTFSYHKIQPALLFGYKQMPLNEKFFFRLADAEKAILDLLYLYPFYNREDELHELRIDQQSWDDTVDEKKLQDYLKKFNNNQLTSRANRLVRILKA